MGSCELHKTGDDLHRYGNGFYETGHGRLHIGCHLSSSEGYLRMGMTALSIGADTFQFFTRNPRGGKAKDIDPDDVASFLRLAQENDFVQIMAHAPYTLNPCAADRRVRAFALEVMSDDLARTEYTPGNFYNFHPGSHVGQGVAAGIELTADLLNRILRPEQTTTVLLETMSGKGSEIGGRFEELRQIIDRVELKEKIGVCFDTCHVYDAGYDIVNDLDGVLKEFDEVIGLERLRAVHINDSKNPFHSRKDRHARIGEGSLGIDTFANVINHPKLRRLPFYLETPNEPEGHAQEIRLLKELYRQR
ncbi:MAG TPA: deoxyribonuclease IV [Clostridiales bacterium]|nr:deoxyribonuclease IV [Clostridiales bacterium]